MLPGIAFRGINESYTESTGVINPATEPLKICGGESDYDTFLTKTGTGTNDARAVHDMLKSKALSLNWMRTFFDGDSNKQPREFDGLNVRLTGGQVIDCNTTSNLLTLAKVDELIDAVQGSPTLLLMNKQCRRKITQLATNTLAVTMGIDQLGRPMQMYGGIPIGVVEFDNFGNWVLDFDENDGSGNMTTCSMYALRLGMDTFHGIQSAPVDVRNLGELPSKPAYRTRIEWYASMAIKHPRAAARLRYIKQG